MPLCNMGLNFRVSGNGTLAEREVEGQGVPLMCVWGGGHGHKWGWGKFVYILIMEVLISVMHGQLNTQVGG